jgi:hypothetical protein
MRSDQLTNGPEKSKEMLKFFSSNATNKIEANNTSNRQK